MNSSTLLDGKCDASRKTRHTTPVQDSALPDSGRTTGLVKEETQDTKQDVSPQGYVCQSTAQATHMQMSSEEGPNRRLAQYCIVVSTRSYGKQLAGIVRGAY
eukprot:GFKZ01011522.1.p1 GENE.GFKZ01011522.1~~GFKZ01011522.1.p1  ORF type:complete len:102 (+),score=4.19 GFKZ01011522.1:342-647(+)